MKLLIAIPALNEEQSIASIIERCLEAVPYIIDQSLVTEIEITVVSDGSTDRTVDIARQYSDRIGIIEFERNKGYGAAITEAWNQSDAELLGFLDADGTCDPQFFAVLCERLIEKNADVLLGCRLNSESHMPLVRRIGNMIFATMLSLFSSTSVRDVASGMRVVRRESLSKLYPLPTGLHFTPAMSARALLSRDVVIDEIDMPYQEREGRSKLHPVKDGVRFLKVILQTTFLYRPSRPLGFLAAGLLLLTCMLMMYPTWFYFNNRWLEEWMIYRFLVGELLATIACLLWMASYLGRKAADIALSPDPCADRYHGIFGWLFSRRWFWVLPVMMTVIGTLFVGRALLHYLQTGEVIEHWSRFVAMMFFLTLSAILSITKIMDFTLNLLAEHLAYLKSEDLFHLVGGSDND